MGWFGVSLAVFKHINEIGCEDEEMKLVNIQAQVCIYCIQSVITTLLMPSSCEFFINRRQMPDIGGKSVHASDNRAV